jgi:hypothetical protein
MAACPWRWRHRLVQRRRRCMLSLTGEMVEAPAVSLPL